MERMIGITREIWNEEYGKASVEVFTRSVAVSSSEITFSFLSGFCSATVV
ncbi:hypothetical protein M077_3944 [Bacteroides fragilis str. 2-F-2 |nr:hypothetical protein M077_3944 [Bacteroides fragilis str. 2-F-2 \